MSWRIVTIDSRCKLDSKMGYLVVRGLETTRVFMDEISLLVIENPAISITGCLLNDLLERKVRIILCDKKHLPAAALFPIHGSYDCSKKVVEQTQWTNEAKTSVWTEIVRKKIEMQAYVLFTERNPEDAEMLEEYAKNVLPGDPTNREGLAAKVYFARLFGEDYLRG